MIQIVDELENMSDNCFTTIMLIVRSIEKNMEFQKMIKGVQYFLPLEEWKSKII